MTDRVGWHFLDQDRRLGNRDGRLVVDGETLTYAGGEIRCCIGGMHASPTIRDALRYANGTILCRVVVHDVRDEQADKFTGVSRTCRESLDVRETLVEFAQWCAKRAVDCAIATNTYTHDEIYAVSCARASFRHAAAAASADARVSYHAADAATNAASAARHAAGAWDAWDAEREAQENWLLAHINLVPLRSEELPIAVC